MAPHTTFPYTGRFVIRLTSWVVGRMLDSIDHGIALDVASLREVACNLGLTELCQILNDHPQLLQAPAASDVSLSDLRELERRATHSPFPPIHSLLSYYILDPRATLGLAEAEHLFQRLRHLSEGDGVETIYHEPELREPVWAVDPTTDDYTPQEGYVKGGVSGANQYKGIDANNVAIWGQYDGGQVGFVDLERAWNLNHEDLPAPAFPVYNVNQ
jgi:hypothetical protein